MVTVPFTDVEIEFSRRNRLIVYYAISIVVVVLLYALLYNTGMRALEGEEHSFFRSLQTVVETMTTTGYGADSPWQSPLMNGFVIFMQISGIAIGFFTLRLVIIPLFTDAEVNLDNRLTPKREHLIICEYRRDSTVLLDELRDLDIDYVLISSDETQAIKLSQQGYQVIHGSPQRTQTFERASIDTARAVLTDAGDATVDTILTVRSLHPEVDLISLTDDTGLRDVLTETGADSVLSPQEVLGHRLAEKAVATFRAELADTVELGADIEVAEIPIPHESQLIGTRIREAGVRERTGANIIGAWIDGELQLPPDPDAVIRPNTVLLVSGKPGALEKLSEVTLPARTLDTHDRAVDEHEHIVIAGLGEVGAAARAVIEDARIDVTAIDRAEGADVDVVGDASARPVLREAGVETADAIIVGVPDDSIALLTTVLARSLNPSIEILIRVTDTETTQKAVSAGADYVLSVPQVSARMIAKELRGEDVLEPASQIRLVRVSARPFAGSRVADSAIAERTGCRIVAIEDEQGVSGEVDPQRTLSTSDNLILVGTDAAVHSFLKQFDGAQVL